MTFFRLLHVVDNLTYLLRSFLFIVSYGSYINNTCKLNILLEVLEYCTVSQTSSSAVAERPRDALCPSVVSLNEIITRVDSFIIVTYASDLSLRNVVFGVTLTLLVIGLHFVVVSRHQQTRLLTSD